MLYWRSFTFLLVTTLLFGCLLASVFGIHAQLYSTLTVTKCCSCCHAACTSRYSHTGNWMLFYEWRGKNLVPTEDCGDCDWCQTLNTTCHHSRHTRCTLFWSCECVHTWVQADSRYLNFMKIAFASYVLQTEGPRSCILIFRIWRRLYK